MARVESGQWYVLHRSFTSDGQPRTGTDEMLGDKTDTLLLAAPQIWNGLILDETSGQYRLGTGGYDPFSGRSLSDLGGTNGYVPFNNNPVTASVAGDRGTDSLSAAFADSYAYYVNPGNDYHDARRAWADGNYWGALESAHFGVGKLGGWAAFVVGTGGVGAEIGIEAGLPVAVAYGGVGVGVTGAGIATYAHNQDATIPEYALNMALGGFSGGFAPGSAAGGLALGVAGGGIGYATTGDWKTGYLIGDFVGRIAGTGVEDALRNVGRLHALGQTAVTGGFAFASFGAGYRATGTVEGGLFWGNIASMPGSMVAKRLVPCFAVGTPIRTPDGEKLIEQLQAGDLVLSRDEHNVDAPVEPKLVEEVFVREGVILNVHVGGQMIRTTPEHPFYVRDRGWTAAGDLEIGDLLSTEDGRWLPVEDLLNTGQVEQVYNLRVADYHTYFVGSTLWQFSVWVHNSYTGFRSLTLAQQIDYLDQRGIGGARQLHNSLESGAPGARFHARRAVHYYQAGRLEAIEHHIRAAGRDGYVDLLLKSRGGVRQRVELKSWWSWGNSSRMQTQLDHLEDQVHKYLHYRKAKLRVEFDHHIFDEAETLLQQLRQQYGNRLTWKTV